MFNDKVSLIFEYDKTSPLFVRQANIEMTENNVDNAIEILLAGLNKYPNFPTAHILLGKAYTLIGEYSKALEQIKTGSELMHSKKTFEHYRNEIDNIKKQRSLFSESRGNAFIPDLKFFEEQPNLFEQEDTKKTEQESLKNFEEDLEELAKKISTASIDDIKENIDSGNLSFENIREGNTIVSETLAKIYEAQGEFQEAIKVYEKLNIRTPEKKDYYLQKISELKNKLNS